MKKLAALCLLFVASLHAQVQLGKGVQIGSASGGGATLPSTPSIVKSTSTTTSVPAAASDVVGLFGTCTSTQVLLGSGLCGTNAGTAIPGTLHQQLLSGGTGAALASDATLDAPGNATYKSYGGTADAQLNQTSSGSNDGIQNALQTLGNAATVNQGYATTEFPANAGIRTFVFDTGYVNTMPVPPFAYNTKFYDYRPGNIGSFTYNPVNQNSGFGSDDTVTKDDNQAGDTGASNYVFDYGGYNNFCCGAVQSNTGQSTILARERGYLDQGQGISTVNQITATHSGTGDTQVEGKIVHCNGGSVTGNDEGCTIHRDEADEDATPFFGTIGTLAAGATVIPVASGGGRPPGENRLLVDTTQLSAPFLVTANTDSSFPTAGTFTTNTTFAQDTVCEMLTAANTPKLKGGGTTSTAVQVVACNAPLVTTLPVCYADFNGFQSVQVTSVGAFSGGAQDATMLLYRSTVAFGIVTQGPNACKAAKMVANTNGQYNQWIRILGRDPNNANVLWYASRFAGNWTTGVTGNFSLTSVPTGTLTRDGSGNVTISNFNDFVGLYQGSCIVIASATDSSYNGNFCGIVETIGAPATLTWSNPGTAGTTTTSAVSYFSPTSAGGASANTIQIAPSCVIVQSNNPSTRANDGTVKCDYNSIVWGNGDAVTSGPAENNLIQIHHERVSFAGANSPSAGQGVQSVIEVDNPCDGCTLWGANVSGHTDAYVGGGGTRTLSFGLLTNTQGSPLFSQYFTLHGPSAYFASFVDCGIRSCSDPSAGYDFFQAAGNGINFTEHWNAFLGQYSTGMRAFATGHNSEITHNPEQVSFRGDDNGGSQYQCTYSLTELSCGLTIAGVSSNARQFSDHFEFDKPIQVPTGSTYNGNIICDVTTCAGVTAVSVATANGFQGSSSGGATPALTINADSTHFLPTNTGAATSYLDATGHYSVPAGGGGGSGTIQHSTATVGTTSPTTGTCTSGITATFASAIPSNATITVSQTSGGVNHWGGSVATQITSTTTAELVVCAIAPGGGGAMFFNVTASY